MNQKMRQKVAVTLASVFVFCHASFGADRGANTVILDATSVENLGVRTEAISRRSFESTFFALGRIETIPSHQGVVSSRVAGRIASLSVFEGDFVAKGDLVAIVESRQAGDPPPALELRTPLSGLVSHGHARLGEPVEPDKEILEVLDLSQVYAVAQVPEDKAGILNAGTKARISIAAIPGAMFEGELLRLSTAVNPESGTIGAIFVLPNPDNQIRPFMRAEFSIVTGRREQVLSVPREALVGDHMGQSVFVKDFDLPNAFIKSAVKTGMSNDQTVEIISGIFAADEVVTRGAYALAYAGGGTVSLKEALDAAHGHEHNEDGSEMTATDRAQGNLGGTEGRGLAAPGVTLFLTALVVLLLILVFLSQWQLARLRSERRGGNA